MDFEGQATDPSLHDPLPSEPFGLLEAWLQDAVSRSGQMNPDAIALATDDENGLPSVRYVLCRKIDTTDGSISFYTNRDSAKGRGLARTPYASAAFYWDAMQRQARISGPVVRSPEEESDAYFAGRARLSQIAAWASRQSEPIASRDELLKRLREETDRFGGIDGNDPIPRPSNWGGYRLYAQSVELWVGSRGRAHDRVLWERNLEETGSTFRGEAWRSSRLQP